VKHMYYCTCQLVAYICFCFYRRMPAQNSSSVAVQLLGSCCTALHEQYLLKCLTSGVATTYQQRCKGKKGLCGVHCCMLQTKQCSALPSRHALITIQYTSCLQQNTLGQNMQCASNWMLLSFSSPLQPSAQAPGNTLQATQSYF
jgi:hypothetical protein